MPKCDMGRVIAIVNQLGMTGKSTTTHCLAEELTRLGRNTAIISLDPMQLPDLMEIELNDVDNKYIKDRVVEVKEDNDFILIDTPSSLGRLTTGALSVADTAIISVSCSAGATVGLTRLLGIIKLIKEEVNAKLSIMGLVLTMFNPELRMAPVIYNDLKRDFGALLFTTVIRKDHLEDYKVLASELCQK